MKNALKLVIITLTLLFGSLNNASAGSSYTYCYASAMCGNPYVGFYSVSCAVNAHANGTACQFFSIPGVGVRCLGVTDWGTWEWVNMSC